MQPGVVAQGIELETALYPLPDLTVTFGMTYADTSYEDDLIGGDSGAPLDPALRLLPGDNLSNAPETGGDLVQLETGTGQFGTSRLAVRQRPCGQRLQHRIRPASGKEQESFITVNGRIGIQGPDRAWSVELWGTNLFDKDYTQVAFNTPFVAPQQTYSAYLAEPRTYGVTVRAGF